MTNHRTAILGAALTLLAACATTRPVFEQSFDTGEGSMGEWLHVLGTRYGCDSLLVRARIGRLRAREEAPPGGMANTLQGRSPTEIRLGNLVCAEVAASVPWPTQVRAWRTPDGIREEWTYVRRRAATIHVYLEGTDPVTLRVVSVAY